MNAYEEGNRDTYVGNLILKRSEMHIEIEAQKMGATPQSDIWACVSCAAKAAGIDPKECSVD